MSTYLNIKKSGWKLVINATTAADDFMTLCCLDHKEAHPDFSAVKSSATTEVFCFEWGSRTYYYKEFCCASWWKQYRMQHRGTHLMRIADQLLEAGFETPRIVCRGRKGPRVFVVSEAAHADRSAYEILMERTDMSSASVDRFRFGFGREIGRLHAAGFVHGDLRWGNILVRDAEWARPSFIFIDNDRTRRYGTIPARERIRNLVQIKYPGSLLEKPESDWEAIWEGYLEGNPDVRKDAQTWRNRVDAKNAKRVEAWWKKPRNRHLFEARRAQEGQVP